MTAGVAFVRLTLPALSTWKHRMYAIGRAWTAATNGMQAGQHGRSPEAVYDTRALPLSLVVMPSGQSRHLPDGGGRE